MYTYLSGFWKKHLTETCLSYITDKILTNFDFGILTGMVLIDLQKKSDKCILGKTAAIVFSWKIVQMTKDVFSDTGPKNTARGKTGSKKKPLWGTRGKAP